MSILRCKHLVVRLTAFKQIDLYTFPLCHCDDEYRQLALINPSSAIVSPERGTGELSDWLM